MPILEREVDLHPADLLSHAQLGDTPNRRWWAFYTRPRREKEMMRKLLVMDIPFYAPVMPHQRRSPSGRVRTSYLPLFPNYVFVSGDERAREKAMTTNCVSTTLAVKDEARLSADLTRLHDLIESGAPLTVERGVETGTRVRIRSGPLRGIEGHVVTRRGKTRLLVSVDFLQQGASLSLEDYDVEPTE